MKTILVIPAMLFAMNVAAQCPAERPSERPELNVTSASSKTDLFQAQTQAQTYVNKVVDYLNCRDRILTALEFNFYVDAAEAVAQEYNVVLRAYGQSKESVAGI